MIAYAFVLVTDAYPPSVATHEPQAESPDRDAVRTQSLIDAYVTHEWSTWCRELINAAR